MSVVGLITEYNPFHNGHLYHINEAKKICQADTVVVVMSGDFVQRGTPAMMDKYLRTQMALDAGADIVIELPVCYACSSAESFALGAVSILDKLGFVDYLVFGSECGNIDTLSEVASIYENEPAAVAESIQSFMKSGLTYPAARSKAMLLYLSETDFADRFPDIDLETFLNSPNNILGMEYMKAIHRLNSKIKPRTIQRIQSEFHSEELSGTINSATAIRKALTGSVDDGLNSAAHSVPDFVYNLMKQEIGRTFPIVPDDTALLLKYKLLSETAESLRQYFDVTDELANRINNMKFHTHNFDSMVDELKSKQFTQTRIQRVLAHILLNITTNSMEQYVKHGYTPYARILGLNKKSVHYLKVTKSQEDFTVITKLATAKLEGLAQEMLEQDIYAAHLYNLIISEKYKTVCKDEYTRGILLKHK